MGGISRAPSVPKIKMLKALESVAFSSLLIIKKMAFSLEIHTILLNIDVTVEVTFPKVGST